MSEYFKSLDSITKERYTKKIGLLSLQEEDEPEEDEPYSERNTLRFINDLTSWPPIEYGHIFCYFVQRPGVYTQKELMQWKSVQAYNFFQSV